MSSEELSNRIAVIALGNPGRAYRMTRHNLGFMVVEELARRLNADPPRRAFNGMLWETHLGLQRVRLLEPIPVSGVQLGDSGEADVKITFKVNDQQILFIKIEAPGVYEERQMEF